MKRASRLLMALLAPALFLMNAFCAFAADPPPVSLAYVELRHGFDLSKAEVGQQLELQLTKPLEIQHHAEAPAGTIMHAHISAVDKEAKHPRVSVVVDDLQVGEVKIPITGIIVAIAPHAGADLGSDDHYGMMASNEPKGMDPNRAISTEANAATSTAAKLNKQGDSGYSLNANSQGAIGIDAKLDWQLATPPPVTVIEAKGKHLTLESHTQMLIRMASFRVE